jgi:rhamnosyltransferase
VSFNNKASVIIPTKNPGDIIKRVLPAVLSQKTDFPFEVLVIDSGSRDGTVDYLKSIAAPNFRYIEIPPADFGHGKTRNLGAEKTDGEYILFLTHDALPVNETWLSQMVGVAESDSRIGGVFGRHIAYAGENVFVAHELDLHFSGFAANPVTWMDDEGRYEKDIGYRQFLHFFSDNNSLLRRSVWQAHPFPDVNFAEDQQWAKTIIENGWRKGYSHDGVVYHSHHYKVMERLRRSFDESYAFKRYFDYDLCTTRSKLWKDWKYLTSRDMDYCFKDQVWKRAPWNCVVQPFDNFARLLGHYLGNHGDSINVAWRHFLSRDTRLFKGSSNGRS